METITTVFEKIAKSGMEGIGAWAPKLLGALVSLIIGFFIIRMIMKGVAKLLSNKKVDDTLRPFLTTIIAFSLKALLFITVASVIGIPMTSFAALIAAAGLAIGMAFQGSLGNLASGIMILLFRPFKVGDLIEVNGNLGFVREISVFVTFLETFQNKTVIIPNGTLTSNTLVNFSVKGNVRADIPFAVRYDSDHDKAKEIVLEILKSSDLVLADPAPSVYITKLGESSVEMLAMPYCTVEDYWDVYWGLIGEIKTKLSAAGYEAPFPQLVYNQKN